MKTIHNIALRVDAGLQKRLFSLGIEVGLGFESFKLADNDERWRSVSAILKEYNPLITSKSIYTSIELAKAEYLEILPSWQNGYPEPSDDFGFLERTYDLTRYCNDCGVGKVQSAPFCMKGEPKWGAKKLLQLFWIGDEYFCKPEVVDQYLARFGISYRPVESVKVGVTLASVVQIDIPTADVELVDDPRFEAQICKACGRAKYKPFPTGVFPELTQVIDLPLFKVKSYVGAGASAYQPVICRNDLFKVLRDAKLKGIGFMPVNASARQCP